MPAGNLCLSMFEKHVRTAIRWVDDWIALPWEEVDWLQVAEDCRWLLRQLEKKALAAGLPDAVRACQVKGDRVTIEHTRQVLATCLAACRESEPVDPVLLTVKQAAARYNMGDRTADYQESADSETLFG